MMHCTMDDLVALRAGEGSVWARKHLEACDACRGELDALFQRVAQLKALPSLRPARDRWPALRAELRGERRLKRRTYGAWTLAAAAVVAAVMVFRPTQGFSEDLAQAKGESAQIESQLQELDAPSRVMSGREAALAAELEDRIAVIDGALARQEAREREAELVQLWQQRVDLMHQLYNVRITRAAYVGL